MKPLVLATYQVYPKESTEEISRKFFQPNHLRLTPAWPFQTRPPVVVSIRVKVWYRFIVVRL